MCYFFNFSKHKKAGHFKCYCTCPSLQYGVNFPEIDIGYGSPGTRPGFQLFSFSANSDALSTSLLSFFLASKTPECVKDSSLYSYDAVSSSAFSA